MTAELALGHLRQRAEVVHLLSNLPAAEVVTPAETLAFVDRHELMGRCIGYVDVLLAVDAQLWTRSKRLAGAANRLGLSATAG